MASSMKSTRERLRQAGADPLRGFRHESLAVPEWDDQAVIIRAPSPSDRLFHAQAIWRAAGVDATADPETIRRQLDRPGVDYTRSSAALLVRCLYQDEGQGAGRVFEDSDVDAVAAAFGPAHTRLVAKAIELGNLGEDAGAVAKKPSKRRRISDS